MSQQVYCIGKGVVSAIGENVKQFVDGLYHGVSGIRKYQPVAGKPNQVSYCANVKSFREQDKLFLMAEQALFESLAEANIELAELKNNPRVGLVFGSSLGNTMVHQQYIQEKQRKGNRDKQSILPLTIHHTAKRLYNRLQIKGPLYCISNTCVTGLNVISLGWHLLSMKQVDVCIVGAAEVLTEFIFTGLNALKALSKKNSLKPFSAERDGIILGEGAGFLVLSTSKTLSKDSAAVLKGSSISNDAVHLTAPDKEAKSMIVAIKESLDEAGISAREIDCIFCCGTGTKYNDAMQALAIHKVWSNYLPTIPVTTIKPLIGHTLGASGLIETIGVLVMMSSGWITPIGGEYKCDPEIPVLPLLHQLLYKEIKKAILLSSGFSGVNGALIIGKDE